MIIECINCNKKFNVDQSLIPENGRQIQCGSCNHSWYFKVELIIPETSVFIEKKIQQEKSVDQKELDVPKVKSVVNPQKFGEKKSDIKKSTNKTVIRAENNKKSKKINLFSSLVVFVISFVALIILVDTLSSPLINIFPGLELILFNLFETLKDIKLFIIDLT
ncbi:zinc-ribbon domain-containing protein [Candidatus Pelagibacter sp.]|nr:zinc-ribbon domain-containing protein [Candidatus Pelagibacter sp.]